MPPDVQLIQDIAIELGVDPAFVEKDWYAIQVLAAISVIKPDQIEVDMQSSPRRMDQDLPTAARMAFGELKTDIAYTDEYGQFVTNMSYEKHDEQLDFQAALARMDEVIAVFE